MSIGVIICLKIQSALASDVPDIMQGQQEGEGKRQQAQEGRERPVTPLHAGKGVALLLHRLDVGVEFRKQITANCQHLRWSRESGKCGD